MRGVYLASFALIFESSALMVALPALAREWRAPFSTLQWVADASLIATALLLLFAGRLSDEAGTRRVMRLGLIGATLCAFGAMLAASPGYLIAIRVIQGASVALVVPGTLGLLRLFIPDEEERLRAMTWWSGISIAGSAAGPIAGGLIVDAGTWRAIFIGPAIMSLIAWWWLRIHDDERHQQRDRASECGEQAPASKSSTSTSSGLFSKPLFPIALLKDRVFLASNLASASVYFAVYGLSFGLATGLPESLASSSLRTGLYMAPPALVMLLLASPVARASAGDRGWWFAAAGSAVCAAGLFVLSILVTADAPSPWAIVASTALIGAGFAATLGPLDAIMMQRPSPEHTNVASAFGHVAARMAGAAAIALGGGMFTSAIMTVVGCTIAAFMVVYSRVSAASMPNNESS